VIRVLRLDAGDDLGPAIRLLQLFFAEEGFDTPAELIAANTVALAALDICGLFAALDGAEAIGVASVSMDFGIEYGWQGEVGDLYVLPARRGEGAARALLDAAEAFMRAKGARSYQVTVTPESEAHHGVKALYGRLGFGDEGRMIFLKQLG
jgi:GNAT superfamily N-acetyltransferase